MTCEELSTLDDLQAQQPAFELAEYPRTKLVVARRLF